MHLTEQVLPLQAMIRFNIMTFLLSLPVGWWILNPIQLKSFVAGFLLCSFNLWALTYLSGLLVQGAAYNTKAVKHIKGLTLFLGAAKFFLFIASLFVMIAILDFSAIHIFIGSFLSLSLSAIWMSYKYLSYIKKVQLKREQEHQVMVEERLREQAAN